MAIDHSSPERGPLPIRATVQLQWRLRSRVQRAIRGSSMSRISTFAPTRSNLAPCSFVSWLGHCYPQESSPLSSLALSAQRLIVSMSIDCTLGGCPSRDDRPCRYRQWVTVDGIEPNSRRITAFSTPEAASTGVRVSNQHRSGCPLSYDQESTVCPRGPHAQWLRRT